MTKLIAKLRSKTRTEGMVPAVLYGSGVENTSLEVDIKGLEKALTEAGESTLVELDVDNKTHRVIIHDLQRSSVKGEIIHVDFYQPNLKEEVEVAVPFIFFGESPAIKQGGTLVKNLTEIDVKALPQDLPHDIRIDISQMALNDEIKIKDIALPKGVKISRDLEETVAVIVPIHEEKEEVVSEEEAVQKVEVEQKKREEVEE